MESTVKRHPIRGLLYGILFGLGLMMIVVGQGWAALGTWPPFIVLILGIVVSILWSTLGPAKKPKGMPPEPRSTMPAPQPEPEPEPALEPEPEPEPEPVGAAEPGGIPEAADGDVAPEDPNTQM